MTRKCLSKGFLEEAQTRCDNARDHERDPNTPKVFIKRECTEGIGRRENAISNLCDATKR